MGNPWISSTPSKLQGRPSWDTLDLYSIVLCIRKLPRTSDDCTTGMQVVQASSYHSSYRSNRVLFVRKSLRPFFCFHFCRGKNRLFPRKIQLKYLDSVQKILPLIIVVLIGVYLFRNTWERYENVQIYQINRWLLWCADFFQHMHVFFIVAQNSPNFRFLAQDTIGLHTVNPKFYVHI